MAEQKKGGWGWASTILAVAAMFIPGGQWAGVKLLAIAAAVITGVQEQQYQQRQAMRAFKKAFGAIGDSALAGSPTYSWDGPQTVSDVSLPVPLCYGAVTVGGNIVNSWTETINIYATKWESAYLTKINEPWDAYVNYYRTISCRGLKNLAIKQVLFVTIDKNKIYCRLKISYAIAGTGNWIVAIADNGSANLDKNPKSTTLINPELHLIEHEYDIKAEVINQYPEFANKQYLDLYVKTAHEKDASSNEVAGHKDIQYLTIALAEGEIESADQTDIMLEDNPIANYGDDFFDYDYSLGSNSQVYNSRYDSIVTENVKNEKLVQQVDSSIFTTQNLDVEALGVVLYFPQGVYQISGNVLATWQVDFTVYFRKAGGSNWVTRNKTIIIKNNNAFKQIIRIDPLNAKQYEIKIKRTSADPDGTTTIGEMWWIGLQEFVTQSQSYPNTAIAYMRLQATDRLSGNIPQFKFKIRGKLVEVPKLTISSVIVPYYMTYWNGTNYVLSEPWNNNAIDTVCTDTSQFVSQWTDNPIWCLRDLINNDHYGLKSYFQSTLNDTDLRLLAKYCDAKVDNGQGGTEKRFQLDIVIDSQDDARNVIERILSTFRGFAVWAENQFKIKINKAENPVQLFTMGNIIENSLSINYTSATDRFNVAKIVYPDRNDANARLSEVMIYDVPLGGMERAQTFNLIGVTRRSQAVRMGRFFLNQAKHIKESIQFKAGLDSIACEAGDVIDFSHDVLQYGLASGRIKASTINSITIDTPISIDTQKTYKVRVMLTDDTIEERTVHNTNSTPPYSLVMTSNFTSIPPVDGIYTFGESGSVTKPYRILSINRDSIQERQITAIEDNASIYSDTGDAVETIKYSSLKNPLQIPDSVTDLTLKELTIDPGDGSKINTILISWNPPTIISSPSIPPTVTTAITGGTIPAGTYYCKYSWIGAGGETLASSYTSIVTTGATSTITIQIPSLAMDATSANVYVGTTIGQEKYQGQITTSYGTLVLTTVPLTGNAIPITNSTQDTSEYDRAKIYLSDSAGAFWEYKGEAKSNFIIENLNKLTYRVAVVSVSLYGIAQSITDASKADITIQGKVSLPSNVSFSGATFGNTVVLTWTTIADRDISFYEIRLNNANWGTVDSNLIYQGLGDKFTLQNPTQTSYTFYIKARDTSGNYSATAGSQATSNTAPSLGAITVDFTGKDCRLSWTPLYDNDLKEYKVFVYSDSNRTILLRSESTQDPNYNYTYEKNVADNGGVPRRLLYFSVGAYDLLNQESGQNASGSNAAPSAPSGLGASNFMEFVYLSWSAVTDIDLIGYNVYVDTVKVAFVAHPSYGHYGSEGVQYNYYIKAVDTFGEGNQSLTVQGTAQGLNIQSTDINNFAVTASKIFTKIPVLESDSWTNNSPSAGYVSWGAHQLFYNGVQYSISGDNTNLKYIYWTGGATYSYSNTNPTLTDAQFIIATNVGGAHDLAWNAIANEVIGSAYIQQAAIKDAHIGDLTAGVIKSGSIATQTLTLAVPGTAAGWQASTQYNESHVVQPPSPNQNGHVYKCMVAGTSSSSPPTWPLGIGDTVNDGTVTWKEIGVSGTSIRAGKTKFGDNAGGFIVGIDDIDSDKVKFEIGDATNYIKWSGTGLDIRGPVTITGSSSGYDNLSDKPAPITTLIARGDCVVTSGRIITKVGGVIAWDSDCYSKESYTGGAYAAAVPSQTNAHIMFGLNVDPATNNSYTSIDYAMYCGAGGNLRRYQSGTDYGEISSTYSVDDDLAVSYDGSHVKWLRNGVVLASVAVSPNLKFYFDSSFYTPDSQLKNVGFLPLSGRNVIYRQGGTVPSGQKDDIWYVTSATTGYLTDVTYRNTGTAWEIIGNNYTNVDQLSDGTTYKKYAATEQTKLTGIEEGATVGATWAVNMIPPIRFADAPSGNGLSFTSINLGFYRDSLWKSYLNNSGEFFFDGNTRNVPWAATIVKSVGNYVNPTTSNGYHYKCIQAGTTGGSQPAWPTTVGATVNDGSVIWVTERPYYVQWDGSTLGIRGNLYADDIVAGGIVTGNTIRTAASPNARIELSAGTKEARWYSDATTVIASIGVESGTDWKFYTLDYSPLNTPSVFTGSWIYINAINRTTTNKWTYGTYSRVDNVRNNTSGLGGVFVATRLFEETGGTAIGLSAYGDTADLLLDSTYYKGRSIRENSVYRKIAYGVFGTVQSRTTNGACTIINGTGFTAYRNSGAVYNVSFTNAFAVAPIVLPQSEEFRIVRVSSITGSGFNVEIVDRGSSGNLDHTFGFFAIVP